MREYKLPYNPLKYLRLYTSNEEILIENKNYRFNFYLRCRNNSIYTASMCSSEDSVTDISLFFKAGCRCVKYYHDSEFYIANYKFPENSFGFKSIGFDTNGDVYLNHESGDYITLYGKLDEIKFVY